MHMIFIFGTLSLPFLLMLGLPVLEVGWDQLLLIPYGFVLGLSWFIKFLGCVMFNV